jgi:hypothetical protein
MTNVKCPKDGKECRHQYSSSANEAKCRHYSWHNIIWVCPELTAYYNNKLQFIVKEGSGEKQNV